LRIQYDTRSWLTPVRRAISFCGSSDPVTRIRTASTPSA
jgi:hypothetical protein